MEPGVESGVESGDGLSPSSPLRAPGTASSTLRKISEIFLAPFTPLCFNGPRSSENRARSLKVKP